jgi:DNA-binding response OmpR family regulator
MTTSKKVLVVDDHFEMLELLRSMLTIAHPDYQVVGVPSAEEGFLELRRTPYDLLITDVRLPGISGFELVRRVQRLRPETPIIMITAYSSGQGKEEAERLGVFRYFQKPLNTDALLAAVKTALHRSEPARVVAAAPEAEAETPAALDSAVQSRLRSLRSDTGAAEVALVGYDGQIVFHLGGGLDEETARLAPLAAGAMRSGLTLSEELQNDEPLMIQYQAGSRFDIYTANVGMAYFVMLLFSVRERRGRIGTIWVFAQRAISELKAMLPDVVPEATEAAAPPEPEPEVAGPAEEGGEVEPEAEPGPAAPVTAKEAAAVEQEPPAPPEATEEPGVEETPDEPLVAAEITSSELAALLSAADDAGSENVDLDAFWEELLDDEGSVPREGLSYEEAMKRGLLPPQFREDGD